MSDLPLESQFRNFLLSEKGFPSDSLQLEASIGSGLKGRIYRADIAVVDPRRDEFLAIVEVVNKREHGRLRYAVAQLLSYRNTLDKPHLPLYLVFPAVDTSGAKFSISQVLPDGSTKDVYLSEFPEFTSLAAGDKAGNAAERTTSARATIDRFEARCALMALGVVVLLILDILDWFHLSSRQVVLAAIACGLIVLPFAAKFKMLGVEFERNRPSGNEKTEP